MRKKLAIRIIKQSYSGQREGVALYILTRNSERGRIGKEHEKITNQYRGDHVQEWHRGSKKETSLSTYQKNRSINARTKRGESKDQSRRVTADMASELIATRGRDMDLEAWRRAQGVYSALCLRQEHLRLTMRFFPLVLLLSLVLLGSEQALDFGDNAISLLLEVALPGD